MLTQMQQKFVEVAARTVLDQLHPGYHLSGYRSDCNSCGGSDVVGGSVNYEWSEFPCPYVGKSESALNTGAHLLGKLEGVNGATIEEIVQAARVVHLDRPAVIGWTGAVDRDAFDPSALFRAIAHEALGQESACLNCRKDSAACIRALSMGGEPCCNGCEHEAKVREEFGEVVLSEQSEAVVRVADLAVYMELHRKATAALSAYDAHLRAHQKERGGDSCVGMKCVAEVSLWAENAAAVTDLGDYFRDHALVADRRSLIIPRLAIEGAADAVR